MLLITQTLRTDSGVITDIFLGAAVGVLGRRRPSGLRPPTTLSFVSERGHFPFRSWFQSRNSQSVALFHCWTAQFWHIKPPFFSTSSAKKSDKDCVHLWILFRASKPLSNQEDSIIGHNLSIRYLNKRMCLKKEKFTVQKAFLRL